MTRATQLMLLLAGISLSAGPLAADEKPAAKPADSKKADAGEVKSLLDQLKSGKYNERNEATKKLMAVGNAAIAPVGKAAMTDDLELGARCVDVLKHYLQHGDAAGKAAAQKALQGLQNSKHASVAKWAGEALRQGGLGANPFGARNGIRMRAGGFGRIGGRIGGRIAPVGFQRDVKAVDNGKTIEIKETIMPGNRQIVVKVTEKVNGKDKTTEYKATTSLDLRRKNKAIYALYLKHIRNARLQIIGANNAAIPVIPGGAAVGRAPGFRFSRHTANNGKRTTTITEPGGRQIVIDEQKKGRDITISITETANGKRKTSRITAKDLAELKKKDAEAAKIYEKYSSFAGMRRAIGRFGGGALPAPRAVPVVPPQRLARRAPRINPRQEIEKANARLQASIDKLQKLAASGKADPKDLRQVADEIKAARKELERATRNLEP